MKRPTFAVPLRVTSQFAPLGGDTHARSWGDRGTRSRPPSISHPPLSPTKNGRNINCTLTRRGVEVAAATAAAASATACAVRAVRRAGSALRRLANRHCLAELGPYCSLVSIALAKQAAYDFDPSDWRTAFALVTSNRRLPRICTSITSPPFLPPSLVRVTRPSSSSVLMSCALGA